MASPPKHLTKRLAREIYSNMGWGKRAYTLDTLRAADAVDLCAPRNQNANSPLLLADSDNDSDEEWDAPVVAKPTGPKTTWEDDDDESEEVRAPGRIARVRIQ